MSIESNFEKIEGLRKDSVLYKASGYLYYKVKATTNKIYLRCQLYPQIGCLSTAIIELDSNSFQLSKPHSHDQESHDEKLITFKTTLKNKAGQTSQGCRIIFDEECRNVIPEISSQISFPMISRTMEKRKSNRYPLLPKDPGEFAEMLKERSSLNEYFKGSIHLNDETVGILFFSSNMIIKLMSFESVCYDGTFYVVPSIFNQLFIISIKNETRYLPTFFILMKGRTSEHYKAALNKIIDLVPAFHPLFGIGDFEKSSMKAFKQLFPEIAIQGCLFHFKQAVLKKIGELHLKSLFKKNKLGFQWLSFLFGIGFLPINMKREAFHQLCDLHFGTLLQRASIGRFIHYFENTWLRNLSIINWFESEVLTNNYSETFNKKLKFHFGVHHSNSWFFVEKLNLMIEDLTIEVIRINNNLLTTRQRNPESLQVLNPSLKRRLLNNEICKFEFLQEHIGIQQLCPELQCLLFHSDSEERNISTSFEDDDYEFNQNVISFLKTFNGNRELETRQCLVCLQLTAGSFHYDCGHSNICRRCTKKLVKRATADGIWFQCPACRTTITRLSALY